ncbi:unnamed protein product [Hermetia illucens]|uniref:Envelope protein n=1 Tax=Hermetia illucens TaxID=343691 RepID=A0A7R8UV93_HERIL|nr:unnamed protein product [Hermetia illucens]
MYYDEDDLARVADVHTKSGILKRPIHKLAPLIKPPTQNIEEATAFREEAKHGKKRNHNEGESAPDASERELTKTPSRQRKRRTVGNVFMQVLLTSLLVPLVKVVVKVVKFTQPGLHFENQGKLNLISNYWKLVVYFNLQPYKSELRALKKSTVTLQQLCQQLLFKGPCEQVVHQIQHRYLHPAEENKLLATKQTPGRMKRGAFDISSLFGVLDSNYATEMSEKISDIHQNENWFMSLLKNHTSILDATINIMKENQETIDQRYKALEELEEVVNQGNNVTDALNQFQLPQLFLSWSIYSMVLMFSIERTQTAILDMVSETHQVQISYLLLSPHQFNHEATKIRTHLPAGLYLPVEPEDTVQLYRLTSVEARLTVKHTIFQIKIPLIGLEEFALFRVLPISTCYVRTL